MPFLGIDSMCHGIPSEIPERYSLECLPKNASIVYCFFLRTYVLQSYLISSLLSPGLESEDVKKEVSYPIQ